MNDNVVPACSFCGTRYSIETPLIVGEDGHICESCVQLASKVVGSWGRKRALAKPFKRPPPPVEIKALLDQYIVGQNDAKEILSVAMYNHYKRLGAGIDQAGMSMGDGGVKIDKSNIMLIGPSGTGKTLLASTLASIIDMPFAVADATTLTQAGYVGDDVETILYRLLDSADGDIERAEWGIVYIDEIDKIARSGESAIGSRDVSGEGVQQALLKLVEGTEVKLSQKSGNKERGEEKTLNTENILFIVGGAFAGVEKIVARRQQTQDTGIGFNATVASKTEPDELEKQSYGNVRTDDLRQYGIIPEFIGRFPVISTLEPLNIEALVRILTEPKNALVKQFRQIFQFDDVELEFTDAALETIAERALALGTGARGLRAILDDLLHKSMYEIPSRKEVTRCVVDQGEEGEIEVRQIEAADTETGKKRHSDTIAAGSY
jgi:ATP-dependent Clp protease ATP-binding subunit ClpX